MASVQKSMSWEGWAVGIGVGVLRGVGVAVQSIGAVVANVDMVALAAGITLVLVCGGSVALP
jgi:hypothetical protein